MAQLKDQDPPGDVRILLAEHLRAQAARRRYPNPVLDRQLADLDAGRDVVVRAWQVARWSPEEYDAGSSGLVRLAADGSLTPVQSLSPSPSRRCASRARSSAAEAP